MQLNLKIHLNRNSINEWEVDNISPNDSFILWIPKKKEFCICWEILGDLFIVIVFLGTQITK